MRRVFQTQRKVPLYAVLLVIVSAASSSWSMAPYEIPVISFNVGNDGDTGKIINKNIQDLQRTLMADKEKYVRLMKFMSERFNFEADVNKDFSSNLGKIKEKSPKAEDEVLGEILSIYSDSKVRDIVLKFPQGGFLFLGTVESKDEHEQFMKKISEYRKARIKVIVDNLFNLYPNAIFLFQELFSDEPKIDSISFIKARDELSDVAIAYSPKYYKVDVKKKDPGGEFLVLELKSLLDESLPPFGIATIHAAGCDPNTPQQYGGGETDADQGNQSLEALLLATKEIKDVILLGDLNVTKKHPRFAMLETHGFREAVKPKEVYSDTAYTLKLDATHRIDHAFYKTNFPGFIRSFWANTVIAPLYTDQETRQAGLDEIEGRKNRVPYANPYGLSLNLNFSPSDHRPIFMVFKLNKK